MFSMKLIEKKVTRGVKKPAADISPHPNKRMRIDPNCSLSDLNLSDDVIKNMNKRKGTFDKKIGELATDSRYFERTATFEKRPAKLDKKTKKNDVCHPIKKMRVNMQAGPSVPKRNLKKERLNVIKKKKNRHFSVISKSDKHISNQAFSSKEISAKSYTKISHEDDINISDKTDPQKINYSIEKTQFNDEDNESSEDQVIIKENVNKSMINNNNNTSLKSSKESMITNATPISIKRKVYHKKSRNDNESSDSSSDSENENWCPWKGEKCNSENEEDPSSIIPTEIFRTPDKTDTSQTLSDAHFKPPSMSDKIKEAKSILGQYESIYSINKYSVLIFVKPNTSLYMIGAANICLLHGGANVFGYHLSKNEKLPFYSPGNYSLLSINCIGGDIIPNVLYNSLNKSKLLMGAAIQRKKKYACISVSSLKSNIMDLLIQLNFRNIFPNEMTTNINIRTVQPNSNESGIYSLFNIDHKLNKCVKYVMDNVKQCKDKKFILCGGKGLGKSTLLKLLINSSLNHLQEGVYCLDLDPGQPEFSLPGTISLVHITSPILGQSFTNIQLESSYKIIKQIYLGSTNVEKILNQLFSAIKLMIATFKDLEIGSPLFVNTFGWTKNSGLDIMFDICRIVQPTNVIEIKSEIQSKNFKENISCNNINKNPTIGIETKNQKNIVKFSYFELDSNVNKYDNNTESSKANSKRDMRILSYLSKLWCDQKLPYTSLNCSLIKVPFNKVALHVYKRIPHSHLLLAINASFIALTKVNKDCLVTIREDRYKVLEKEALQNNLPECVGFGVVKGIDVISKEIHILTPLSEERFNNEVNCLIGGNICIPERFYEIFGTNDAPYHQVGIRKGAGKLAVGRKSKTKNKRY